MEHEDHPLARATRSACLPLQTSQRSQVLVRSPLNARACVEAEKKVVGKRGVADFEAISNVSSIEASWVRAFLSTITTPTHYLITIESARLTTEPGSTLCRKGLPASGSGHKGSLPSEEQPRHRPPRYNSPRWLPTHTAYWEGV